MRSIRVSAESDLVSAAIEGNRVAFAELCELHFSAVYGLCRRLTRDRHAAENLAQETFAKAQTSMSTFDPAKPFLPWVQAMARNIAIDEFRAQQRRPQETELDENTLRRSTSHSSLADSVINHVVLNDALDSMPRRSGQVIQLWAEGNTYKEISAEIGATMSATSKVVSRAKLQLRERVGVLRGLAAFGLLLRMRLRSAVIQTRLQVEAFVDRFGEQCAAACMGIAGAIIGAAALTVIAAGGTGATADQWRQPGQPRLIKLSSDRSIPTPSRARTRRNDGADHQAFDAGPVTVGTGHSGQDNPDPTGGYARVEVVGPDGKTWFWYENHHGCNQPHSITPAGLPIQVRC